ncbi:MAG TPA: Cys-tRNA(Pro) deacylase [Staphylococcus sp.]|uniref:Cys-tRNA(Pro)/Cys-tRNA(Cys) deacylase n=1 Tax=Mammaliicoccus vitulinus TaxID=71237 RepID=A0A2T4PTV3_9STAP|nr:MULTISPECIES: Cys-tRNA(Pro) deacylase [Mammaliicoccus]PTI29810.1 Cys-tRNA(Pro) deacylase [Mammaliicoccus vitulinus]PTI38102.1 Cys-tRNA(Pro) deacylase [Mammaliicoccus vitulinus]RIN23703.1 Cys-tRNA(Pro) deacylase [Mammaliicoccus vitulinus]HAL10005.1 Cys-tRNA(Pro) deacylase [Staphylococcus sp.]
MKKVKTNAMRILDQYNIFYHTHEYSIGKDYIDGHQVAQFIQKPENQVYKTLVLMNGKNEYFVFVIPVVEHLDMKKASKAVGQKKLELLPLDQLTKVTGYVRGGCSPVGMKKTFRTIIDTTAQSLSSFIVSAGKRGYQIEVNPQELVKVIDVDFEDVIKYN